MQQEGAVLLGCVFVRWCQDGHETRNLHWPIFACNYSLFSASGSWRRVSVCFVAFHQIAKKRQGVGLLATERERKV